MTLFGAIHIVELFLRFLIRDFLFFHTNFFKFITVLAEERADDVELIVIDVRIRVLRGSGFTQTEPEISI